MESSITKIDDFSRRLDMEFGLMPTAIDQQRAALEREYHERQKRFEELFMPALAQLRAIWEPRRDALLARFKDIIHIKPAARDDFGEVTFSFDSALARISLRFTFSHDPDVRNIILEYHLEIVPILMKFDNHSILELQLAIFDQQVAALWLEDRMVSFIRTFVELNGNQYYLKDHMVEDPIAHVRLPRSIARETVDWEGHKYYFICGDTRREFEKLHGSASSPNAMSTTGFNLRLEAASETTTVKEKVQRPTLSMRGVE
jgi:YHS domain-containing protein